MSAQEQFRAIVVDKREQEGDGPAAVLQTVSDELLMPGDVTITVAYSSLNYKDGMSLGGNRGIVRHWPLIPGIDLVGTVEHSLDPRWAVGDEVILNGAGIGESHHGGFAERARVSGDFLVRRPAALSAKQAAAIGTAGFTSMLCLLALERGGITPASGPVLVTGAAGGVGSVAVALLAGRGYQVTASTGRAGEQTDFLRELGAADVIDRAELDQPGKPLQTPRWAAAVDSVGSVTLANVLAQTNYGGVVAACGLAQGADLPTTVLPFILRAVTLTGANSVDAPLALREEAWRRLSTDLSLPLLDRLTETIPLAECIEAGERILAGRVRGRTVVDVRA
jgi:acrylyl-CoA reductase (NADPH)